MNPVFRGMLFILLSFNLKWLNECGTEEDWGWRNTMRGNGLATGEEIGRAKEVEKQNGYKWRAELNRNRNSNKLIDFTIRSGCMLIVFSAILYMLKWLMLEIYLIAVIAYTVSLNYQRTLIVSESIRQTDHNASTPNSFLLQRFSLKSKLIPNLKLFS